MTLGVAKQSLTVVVTEGCDNYAKELLSWVGDKHQYLCLDGDESMPLEAVHESIPSENSCVLLVVTWEHLHREGDYAITFAATYKTQVAVLVIVDAEIIQPIQRLLNAACEQRLLSVELTSLCDDEWIRRNNREEMLHPIFTRKAADRKRLMALVKSLGCA
ncbi:MAG TPA: hypothetical protein PLF31_01645 [Candidatus Paceibacterota bacterium]|nr:hypothetical protein [Candidatus Paceibacterota bacterium]